MRSPSAFAYVSKRQGFALRRKIWGAEYGEEPSLLFSSFARVGNSKQYFWCAVVTRKSTAET